MHVIIARWRVQPGSLDEVLALAAEMAGHARSEPGCRQYTLNQSLDDPNLIVLYEQYDDEDAFRFHIESEPFKRLVLGRIVPLLADRSRETFHTVGDAPVA
jgi:(4S)-4-hydroxy-5-phosphonooxypentane-2,3-dione isomerase